ncbi:MAG: DUF1572 family protein [Bacteroidota bacterium]
MSTSMNPNTLNSEFLTGAIKLFRYYKKLGEGAIAQLNDEDILKRPNEASNNIALIVHHLSGNMLSRWTDFLTSDGEKSWRNREAEFEESYPDKKTMMEAWDKGWSCLLNALESLKPEDLSKVIYIRNEGQSVLEAIQRQLAHYPSHVGQIIFHAKALKGDSFTSLSIPKGTSASYNKDKFSEEKGRRHFTDGIK